MTEEPTGPSTLHCCNFCGKRLNDPDISRFIEKNGSWICEVCIKACYDILREDDGEISNEASLPR